MNHTYLSQAYTEIKPFTRGSCEDAARLQRGMRLAERQISRPYYTTLTECTCPDRHYRGLVCKHMRALQLQTRAAEIAFKEVQVRALAPEILEALRTMYRHFAISCLLAGTYERHPALLQAREIFEKLELPAE